MLSDTTELLPPHPAFMDTEIAAPKDMEGRARHGLNKKRDSPGRARFSLSISSLLSFNSRASQSGLQLVINEGPQEDVSSSNNINGPYASNSRFLGRSTPTLGHSADAVLPISKAPLSRETKSFLTRVSAAFRRPSISNRNPLEDPSVSRRQREGSSSSRLSQQSSITAPPRASSVPPEDYFNTPGKTKDDQNSEKTRLSSFRFGRTGLEHSSPNSTRPLPSPSEGLFESSQLNSWARSQPPAPLVFQNPRLPSPMGSVLSDDSTTDHIFPLPPTSSLSSILTPIIEPSSARSFEQFSSMQTFPPNLTLPPTPALEIPSTPVYSRVKRLTLLPLGISSPDFEDALISPSLTRSRSPSETDSDLVATPTLLESALSLSGCKLKESTSPKTWASSEYAQRSSILVERPVERGVWGLTPISPVQLILPSSASIVFEEPSELVATDYDTNNENSPLDRSEYAKAFSSHHASDARSRRSQSISVILPSTYTSSRLVRGGTRRSLSLSIHDHTSMVRRMQESEGGSLLVDMKS